MSGANAPLVIGRYTLYAPLAAGGMATVHLARLLGSVGFSRTVAIKRLHKEFVHDAAFVSMFLDEARLVTRIKHPNVVPTLDVVSAEGELFLVMEYVQGETLSRLLQAAIEKNVRVHPRIAVAVMAGVLHGLHDAHQARNEHGEPLGIVHRDVSPQNVMVGADGVARVLDFGIARSFGRAQNDVRVMGKLGYMPPEQVHAQKLDARTDVYAASVVLWETLTRRRLFQGGDKEALVEQILSGPLEPPSVHHPDVSPELDAIVMRGLSRNPSGRFPTAREMALALEACVPPETNAAVGQWVNDLAGNALAERAALVADVESASAPVSLKQPDVPKPDDVPTVVEGVRSVRGDATTSNAARWAAIAVGAIAGGLFALAILVRGC
jgi:serine/threonine protein kinase